MGKKITMFSTESSSIQERFEQYLSAASAKGLSSKTLKTYPAHCHCSALHLIYARKRQRQREKLSLNFQAKGGVSDDRRRHCTLHGGLVRPLHPHWLHLITAPTTDLSTNLH